MTTKVQAALGAVLLVVLPALLLAHDSPALAGLAVVATVVVALLADTPLRGVVLVGAPPARPDGDDATWSRRDRVTAPVTHPRRPRAPEAA
ncbi:MAG TPA: hypothetical protein VMF51_07360 [Nocardioides sp.]|jgi:hypothetical protein|uniref:hypothetical protein n=1 Tax=Nocardioides sp. TaxID=35761 RepID=UPI002B6CF847|nr:hypothetical protein [Nocardioides sp.]HTW14929.1 hypothetical protein [Nocardioides sp.]